MQDFSFLQDNLFATYTLRSVDFHLFMSLIKISKNQIPNTQNSTTR